MIGRRRGNRRVATRRERPTEGRRPREGPAGGSGHRSASPFLGWLQEHPRAALASLGRLWRSPVAAAMTMAVIAIALSLPGALWILLKNAEAASAGWDTGARISVYLQPGLEQARVEAAYDSLATIDGGRIVRRISADEALDEFRALAGFDRALEALDSNPLPAVAVIEPRGDDIGTEALTALVDRLQAVEGVDRAQIDLEWVERFYALLELIERGIVLLALLLAAGVLLIVGNTIRLDVLNRRSEIEVIKLIGGTDAFIKRPFLYSGFWYGLGGGLGASALLVLLAGLLAGPTADLASAYGSSFRLHGLTGGEAALLLLGGGLLGLLGSRLAVGRHLRAIEPG